MGKHGVLCALSSKRRALLEEDPELLTDVIGHRHRERIPGLFDLDEAWEALDVLLGEDEDELLGDAVLARSGAPFGPDLGYGRAKLLTPDRVLAVSRALAALADGFVDERFVRLEGRRVQGGYGPKPPRGGPEEYAEELAALGDEVEVEERAEDERAEREELETRLEALKEFFRGAAERREAVVAVVA